MDDEFRAPAICPHCNHATHGIFICPFCKLLTTEKAKKAKPKAKAASGSSPK